MSNGEALKQSVPSAHMRVRYILIVYLLQDEEVIEQEERAREEQRRREEQERALAAQRERERREREEFERRGREERERLEREKKEKLASRSTSGVRGIRGTRAQMMRGAATTRGLSRSGQHISRCDCYASLPSSNAHRNVSFLRDTTYRDSSWRNSWYHRQRPHFWTRIHDR